VKIEAEVFEGSAAQALVDASDRARPESLGDRVDHPTKSRLGRRMAHFKRLVTNHSTLRFAGSVPTFGIVMHTGRRSRRQYRTPVNAFPTTDGFLIALTYGTDSQWMRNVLAPGGARVVTRRREYRLAHLELVHDARRQGVTLPMRLMFRLVGVADFLSLGLVSQSQEV
jgi:deazaflavin-dependent oxidoreductase (nitroreductase family)